jgi:hypothetical protein
VNVLSNVASNKPEFVTDCVNIPISTNKVSISRNYTRIISKSNYQQKQQTVKEQERKLLFLAYFTNKNYNSHNKKSLNKHNSKK